MKNKTTNKSFGYQLLVESSRPKQINGISIQINSFIVCFCCCCCSTNTSQLHDSVAPLLKFLIQFDECTRHGHGQTEKGETQRTYCNSINNNNLMKCTYSYVVAVVVVEVLRIEIQVRTILHVLCLFVLNTIFFAFRFRLLRGLLDCLLF